MSRTLSRREFLATTAAATVATTVAAPAVLTAGKTDKQVILGQGDLQYAVMHDWPQLPDKY